MTLPLAKNQKGTTKFPYVDWNLGKEIFATDVPIYGKRSWYTWGKSDTVTAFKRNLEKRWSGKYPNEIT